MLVRFTSDSSVTSSGFVASWTSTTSSSVSMCSTASSTSSSDTLTDSGGSGSNYSNNEFCDFLIQPTGASSVTLIFSAFNLESGFDFLTVYDGSTSASPTLINNLSGNSLPSSVTSSGGTMLVRFTSDTSVTSSGFIANWTSTTGVVCPVQSVGDNFPSVSYSQNSGSQNWTGDWTEVGESDGTSAGIARVRSDLCTSGNCLRLGVPSDQPRQTYSNQGVYREVDLSNTTNATLSFVYRHGRNRGNQTVVLSVSNDGGSSWSDLQSYFINSTNTSPTSESFNISTYATSSTRIRFLASGNNAIVGMYIDDISINYQPTCTPIPVIDYHFDELSWNGTTDEVLDNSGNNNHAMADAASGLTTVDPGQICRAGQFDGTNDYIESSSVFSTLRSTASLSFWLKTTQSGNNTGWTAPGIAGAEQSGGTDVIFWGWLDASGRIGISVANDFSTKSTVAINNGVFHHVVLTRDSPTGAYKIYIDGVLDNSGTLGTGDIGTNFSSIGRIEDTGGTPEYIQGDLDEVLVFDSVLTDAQVNNIYTEQLAGNNFDGTARSCPTPALDHFSINHDSTAVNCQAENITISAHTSALPTHTIETGYTGTINLSTSTGHGDWGWVSNGSASNLTNSGNGIGSYNFDGTENGTVILSLANTFAEDVSINVSNGSITETSGVADSGDDPNLNYAASGFQFLASGSPNTIGTQNSGESIKHWLWCSNTGAGSDKD